MHHVLVTGDRNWTDAWAVSTQILRLVDTHGARNVLLIAGGCRGLDLMAEKIAKDHGIHVARIDALWDSYHRGAGPIRNGVMLTLHPNEVLAFHNDIENSSGTANCIKQARELGADITMITSETRPG